MKADFSKVKIPLQTFTSSLFYVKITGMIKAILKEGERIDQLFSSDVRIIQNKDALVTLLIASSYPASLKCLPKG